MLFRSIGAWGPWLYNTYKLLRGIEPLKNGYFTVDMLVNLIETIELPDYKNAAMWGQTKEEFDDYMRTLNQ